jgi:hypothetical protein
MHYPGQPGHSSNCPDALVGLSTVRKIIAGPTGYKALYGRTLIRQIINVLFLGSFQSSLIVPNKRPILLKETRFRSRQNNRCNAQ